MNKIAFIGAGNMARAITMGLVNSGIAAHNIIVANPSEAKRITLANELGISQTGDNIKAALFADVIVLCVKPHLIRKVCLQISDAVNITGKLFISVAAGTTIEQIQSALATTNHEKLAPVVRVMPNTPSQISLGMSGLYASSEVSEPQKVSANNLMAAVGKVIWLETEEKINNIIAVAGSAPAYYFLFMEAMEKQAITYGFTPEESRMLVQQTLLGTAQMVAHNEDIPISELRANVTSKGGTTQAAIESFNDNGIDNIIKTAMDAAILRAEEIAK